MKRGLYERFAKRVFDICVSLICLIVFWPVLLVVALLSKWKFGTPILFTQVRPGLNAQAFNILKFRTMTNARNPSGILLPDAKRLTRYGQFLRSSSIDELPALINVLRGDMSLVGPRPLLMQYLPLYSAEQHRRHLVRPGITGWAQVNGRNAISWEQKFEYDCYYVDHVSLSLDLKILVMTALKVFKRDGISHQGEATMPYFTGSKK
jgi:sugar transferase EpsL